MAVSTTVLNVEAAGLTELVGAMKGLQASMNTANQALYKLNTGLGLYTKTSSKSKEVLNGQAAAADDAAASSQKLRLAMVQQSAIAAQLDATTQNLAQAMNMQAQKAEQTGGSWNKITRLAGGLAVGAAAAYGAIKAGIEIYKSATAAAEKQALAENNLTSALNARNIDANINNLKDWASSLQNVTTTGDEVILNLASQAAAFSGNETQIKTTTKAAMDFAAATGKDAETAIKAIGSAINGQTNGLKELGIYLTENDKKQLKNLDTYERQEKIISLLNERYGGFSEKLASTPTGQIEQAKNSLGDIWENVGRLLKSDYTPITKPIEYVNTFLTEINKKFDAWVAKITAPTESKIELIEQLGAAEKQARSAEKQIIKTVNAANKLNKVDDIEKRFKSQQKLTDAQEKAAIESAEFIDNEAAREAYIAEIRKKFSDQRLADAANYYRQTGNWAGLAADNAYKFEEQYTQKQAEELAKRLSAEEAQAAKLAEINAKKHANLEQALSPSEKAQKAFDDLSAKVQKNIGDNLKTLGGMGADLITGLIEGTGDWRETLYNGFKSMAENMIKVGIENIMSLAVQNQAAAAQSQYGIPYIGPILAVAAGAAALATTIALKSKLKKPQIQYANGGYISAGMVKGGAVGADSVPALLQAGERVLSKREAEQYDKGQSGAAVFNINVNISGSLSTPEQLRETVRNKLIPEIQKACRQGYKLA